jgi:hypothetical protein
MPHRNWRAAAAIGAAALAISGCGGGSGPDVPKALTQQIPASCGAYWQPKTVAAALGHRTVSHVTGKFDKPARGVGDCEVDIPLDTPLGGANEGPYLTLEVDDRHQPADAAQLLADECDPRGNAPDQTVSGPGHSCAVFRADPSDDAIQGGRIRAQDAAGTLFVQVTIEGVNGTRGADPTLDADRTHAFQLLAEAVAAAKP